MICDEKRQGKWADALASNQTNKRVGICWRGAQRQGQNLDQRSMNLEELKPLFNLPNTQYYNLQHTCTKQEQNILAENNVICFNDLDADGAFVDTAAIIKNLDLVITVDTAIAHLAGGLGVPVWVMLNAVPEWRYCMGQNIGDQCTPWYKTMRLFKQTQATHWGSVIQNIINELYKN